MITIEIPPIARLDADDDPDLWRVAVPYILAEACLRENDLVEVGRCSHWLRPHQMRWKADGGFACPVGYGGSWGGSRQALPQFDWSVLWEWTDAGWSRGARRSRQPAVRIAIPARTARHRQAAIHVLLTESGEKDVVFYGFRKRKELWVCTAATEWSADKETRP